MKAAGWIVALLLLALGIGLQVASRLGEDIPSAPRGAGDPPGAPPAGASREAVASERGPPSPDDATVRELRRLLASDPVDAKRAAVLLETLDGPPAVALLRDLSSRDIGHELLQQVLRRLEILGGSEGVRVLHAIARERPQLAGEAAVRLSRVRGRDAAPALRQVIEDESRSGPLAAAALRALGATALRSEGALCRAVAMDGAKDADVRVAAIEALGAIADPIAVPDLVALLGDDDARLRRFAIRSLGRIRSDSTLAGLEAFIESGPRSLERNLAIEALARLRGEPLPWR